MSGIVNQLQMEAIKENGDILKLLRQAYIIARKLKLSEFEQWVKNELDGYDEGPIPDYRLIKGEVKGFNPVRGWIPFVLPDKLSFLSERRVNNSIANLVEIYRQNENNDRIYLSFDPRVVAELSKLCGFDTIFYLFVGKNQVFEIIEKIRNILLEWAITLEEKGIKGENLEFTLEEEKLAEKEKIINSINFYGDVINSQIQQDTEHSQQGKKK